MSVPDLLTSIAEVTIPEADLGNPQKLKTLKDIVLANRGDLHLILRLKSLLSGETVVRCGNNFKIVYNDSVFKQVGWLFGVNCIKRSNRCYPLHTTQS